VAWAGVGWPEETANRRFGSLVGRRPGQEGLGGPFRRTLNDVFGSKFLALLVVFFLSETSHNMTIEVIIVRRNETRLVATFASGAWLCAWERVWRTTAITMSASVAWLVFFFLK